MPRTKTAEAGVSAASEPRKKRVAVSKPASGVHKHATNKEVKKPETVRAVTREEIASLAYSFWESRGYEDGFAEGDWLRAERELLILA